MSLRLAPRLVWLVAILSVGPPCHTRAAAPSPEDSHAALRANRGIVVELAAAEPEVVDPVAIAFDADGRMWVAEMGDYPLGGDGLPGDRGPAGSPATQAPRPQSRIRVLEDRDGDGLFETATRFADGLAFVTGITPWNGGVIVTLAGEVAWLCDTDGDGRADRHDTRFTGFTADNSQLRANHPTLGPDGMVYVANGLRGGAVVAVGLAGAEAAGAADAPLDIRGRDFRFDPRGTGFGAVTGHGQFGMSIDDFGTRFVCSNRNPCVQVMLEAGPLDRNPALALAAAVHDVAPAGEASRIHPLSAAWTTSNLHAGQFTAACGVTIHRGDGLPEGCRGAAFTCDPTGNLVHRARLGRSGPAFVAEPGGPPEFLASPDDWFRPVSLADGPDGCLYVVDMCRAVIEHPEFMPDELKGRPDLRDGDDRGRVWRVRAADRPRRPAPRLSAAPTADLIPLLDHADGWHRDTAARLLLERAAALTEHEVAAITAVAADGRTAEGRSRAAFLLHAIGRLDAAVVIRGLADPHPRVRETALKLAGPGLASSPDLARGVIAAAGDPDAAVRFEAAVRLGDMPPAAGLDREVVEAVAAIATSGVDDRWTRAAVATACPGRAAEVLVAVLARVATGEPGGAAALVAELADLAAAGGEDVQPVIAALARLTATDDSREPLATAVVSGLGRGYGRRRSSLATVAEGWTAESRAWLDAVFTSAAQRAADASADEAVRVAAIGVLAEAGFATAGPVLLAIAAAEPAPEVRLAAVAAVAGHDDPAIDAFLVADDLPRRLSAATPAIRRALLDAACDRPGRAARLLDMIEEQRLPAAAVSAAQWDRLGRVGDDAFRGRVARVRQAAAPADRLAVVTAYERALALEGDVSRGRVVFAAQCAGCHRVGDVGVDVGPDISDSRTKQPAQYLVDILDPNRAIDANYFATTAVRADGRIVSGIVAAEAAGSVTLRQQDGATVTLLKDEIEELSTAGVSFMPVGLERAIDVPQMADLIAFLKGWRYAAAR